MVDYVLYIFVFLIGFISSLVGTIGGAGGLLSIPFLMFVGLPPQIAIATNKFGSLGRSFGAIPKFFKEKKINWKYVPPFIAINIVGAVIGANLLISINEELLTKIVGFIILLVLPFLFFKKDIGTVKKKVSANKERIGFFMYFLVSIFAAFFGGGSGTFIFYVLMIFFGFTIIEANGTDQFPALVLSISAIVVFAINGIIDYVLGFFMLLGMLFGGYTGARLAIKNGNGWTKKVFGIIVAFAAIKLLFFG